MATVNPTIERSGDFTVTTYTYPNMANGDDGAPIKEPAHADRTIQATGTFGTGGSVAAEGSNNGTDFGAMNDATGTLIAMTTTAPETPLENPLYVRPRVTAGDVSTDLTVIIVARRPTDKRQ